MNLFQKVGSSIYDPAFYQELLQKPFSFSLKYFYSFAITLAFIITLILAFIIVPHVDSFLSTLGPRVLSYYPDGVVVSIQEGKASINQSEPYQFPMPDDLKGGSNGRANLLVVDTQRPFSRSLLESYNTHTLLTKDDFVFFDGDGSIRVESLVNVPNVIVDKPGLEEKVRALRPYIKFIAPILVVILFFGFIIIASWQLIYLLFGALGIWAIARFKGLSIGYKKAYQIGLHAITLAVLLDLLLLFFLSQLKVLFLFTAVMLIVVTINLRPVSGAGTEPSTRITKPSLSD